MYQARFSPCDHRKATRHAPALRIFNVKRKDRQTDCGSRFSSRPPAGPSDRPPDPAQLQAPPLAWYQPVAPRSIMDGVAGPVACRLGCGVDESRTVGVAADPAVAASFHQHHIGDARRGYTTDGRRRTRRSRLTPAAKQGPERTFGPAGGSGAGIPADRPRPPHRYRPPATDLTTMSWLHVCTTPPRPPAAEPPHGRCLDVRWLSLSDPAATREGATSAHRRSKPQPAVVNGYGMTISMYVDHGNSCCAADKVADQPSRHTSHQHKGPWPNRQHAQRCDRAVWPWSTSSASAAGPCRHPRR
jgi:hypothetical protein